MFEYIDAKTGLVIIGLLLFLVLMILILPAGLWWALTELGIISVPLTLGSWGACLIIMIALSGSHIKR